jgi:hypothetical protein
MHTAYPIRYRILWDLGQPYEVGRSRMASHALPVRNLHGEARCFTTSSAPSPLHANPFTVLRRPRAYISLEVPLVTSLVTVLVNVPSGQGGNTLALWNKL